MFVCTLYKVAFIVTAPIIIQLKEKFLNDGYAVFLAI